jgi:hypothetical protein
MLTKSIFHQAAVYALAATLATPSFGLAAEKRIIYPGQKLPAELGLSSLKVSSSPDADVQVMARDWFLLKDKQLALANPVPGKSVDYAGPVLETTNAQMYFRLISGMILKESLQQMGMSSTRARHYIERARQSGKDFETAPLKELGELPEGLKELYNNWERPNAKIALLPYIVLPLAVANDQSQFQHFFKAKVEDGEQQKTCSTINTSAPLGPIQTKLNEKNKVLETLDNELATAKSNLDQANLEQIKISGQIKTTSESIESANLCFSTVKDRVSRGGAMPDQACLTKGAEALAASGLAAEWTEFVAKNLSNDKGDFAMKQQAELELKTKEARLTEVQNQIKDLTDLREKAKSEQAANDSSVATLQARLEGEKTEELKLLDKEKEKINEKDELIKMSIQLQSDEYRRQIGEEKFGAEIAATQERNKKVADLSKEIGDISKSKTNFQVSQASLLTQIQHLKSSTDEKRAQLQSIDGQLNGVNGQTGLIATSASLESEVKDLTAKFLALQDKAAKADYVLSILARRVAGLSQERDGLINALKKKEEQAEGFKKQIAAAAEKKDAQYPGVSGEAGSLAALIASYHDLGKMGWFLETDCLARANVSANNPGIYLGRAKIADSNSKVLPSSPVDGGRWGLFNLDYAHFADVIQNGILLNVPSYVQMAVHQLIENYDYAVSAQFDSGVYKCNDPEAAKGAAGPTLNAMKAAFAIWNEGNGEQAKAKAFNCRNVAPSPAVTMARAQVVPQTRPAGMSLRQWRRQQRLNRAQAAPVYRAPVAQPQIAVRNFASSLNRLIAFNGSVLDMALPQAGRSHDKDLIERNAITSILRELGILSGTVGKDAMDSDTRREQTVKALLQVLAFDYEAELAKQNSISAEKDKYEFIFATAAPGKQVSTAGLVVGQSYPVKSIGRVRLYTQPIAKDSSLSTVELGYNDMVKVLPLEDVEGVSQAGWVKVLAGDFYGYLPASLIASSVILDQNGQEMTDVVAPTNCQHPRLVASLTNFRRSATVERFSSNLKSSPISRRSRVFTIDADETPRVAAASTEKTYLACDDYYAPNGQSATADVSAELQDSNGVDYGKVQGIRIIEARKVETSRGPVYLPLEDVGGFVQTWLPSRNGKQPRITLGAEIDTSTWGIKQ